MRQGYEIGYFSETIQLMSVSVSGLTTFALTTKRMTIGCTQIVRHRTPLVMAQTFASRDKISEGCLMVDRAHVRMHMPSVAASRN